MVAAFFLRRVFVVWFGGEGSEGMGRLLWEAVRIVGTAGWVAFMVLLGITGDRWPTTGSSQVQLSYGGTFKVVFVGAIFG